MKQPPPELGNFIIAAKHVRLKFFMFIINVSNEINITMVTMELDYNFNICGLKGLIDPATSDVISKVKFVVRVTP